jgi:hypothetical protein
VVILPRIKFGVIGQESSPQSPTFHAATVTNKPKKNDSGNFAVREKKIK